MNDASLAWTVFVPNDAAIAAYEGTVNLQAHVYTTAAVDSTQATGLSGSEITMNDGTKVAIAGGGTEPLTVGGHEVTDADLMIEGGQNIVHIIDGVLE